MAEQQTQFVDLYRAGMKSAMETIKASLESAERVQNRQMELVRAALDENAELQARFAGAQMQAMEFWSNFWRAAGDNQMAMFGQWQSQARSAASQVETASSRLQEAARKSA